VSLAIFTLGAIALTIGAYRFSLFVRRRWAHPLTTPVLFSTSLVVAMLLLVRADASAYEPAKGLMSFLLGPATVALAIPLYRNRETFRRRLGSALGGLLAGIVVTIALAIVCGRAFGLESLLQASLAVKSATAAIAVEIARIVHGDSALAAGFVVCTGTFGAAIGPWLLDRVCVEDPVARGVAYGAISHGIGTAQAASESELAGAVAGVSLGIGGILTAALAPLFLRLLGN